MRPVDYHRPRDVEEARVLAAELPEARYIAGGTDLLVLMKEGAVRPGALVSLRAIPELAGVTQGEETRIGALTPFADLQAQPELGARFPVLHEALRTLGTPQIRSVATIGGNLCNAAPCADSALPLLLLGARVRVLRAGGATEVPLESFFLGPGETVLEPGDLLTDILVPAPPAGDLVGAFLKHRRVHADLALVSVAVLLQLAGDTCRCARVAAGSVAPTPVRLTAVERHLEGEALTRSVRTRAGELAQEAIAPISDVRATADYRRELTAVLVERALERALERRPS
jgi:carbon-monoxide dehydrogenase medium subunit